jgi:nitroreductase
MNNVIRQILTHRSIRKYKSKPIPAHILEEIISCGLHSSSSGNLQTWTVIATQNSKSRRQLYRIHGQQEMILQAPCVLTFCADIRRLRKWLRVSKAKDSFDDLSGFLFSAFDAMIAAQSVAIAAESLGLGICYMGTTLREPDKISKALKIPKGVIPVTSLVIGYPNEKPNLRDRLPLAAVFHKEKYKDFSTKQLKALFAKREIDGWRRYQEILGPEFVDKMRRYGIHNLAQFYSSPFKYNKVTFSETSKKYLQSLKAKNFWNF